ncbi:MNN15 putative alpha-1 [Candida maltosa Xu316]|uniref:Alpha-1,3-mannosyltransferase n=1 Tax=Candida maltosa (strain Xu316) TaxID=1245528 RepID=M3J6Q9_CANMX|nr:hypothetical protein G210_1804 [Candida maltosa Xu316]
MRFTIKRIILLSVALFLILIGYLSLQLLDLQHIHDLLFDTEKFDLESLKAHSLQIRNQIHYSNYLFSGYNNFTSKFPDLETIKNTPLDEKCQLVFDLWKEQDPEWQFRTYNALHERYDKSSDRKEFFFDERIKEMKKKYDKKKSEGDSEFSVSRSENKTISRDFMANVEKSKVALQKMADTVTLMRLYGKCFIGRDINESLTSIYKEFTGKFFPFLDKAAPKFRKAEDDVDSGWPVYEDDKVVNRVTEFPDNAIDFISRNTKGRGIVISSSTRHSRDAMRLIKVLRALNNKLPIQILYKNDITMKAMEGLKLAAVGTPEEILHPSINSEHTNFMPELKLLEQYKEYGSEFPKQDLTFVNIVGCVQKGYKFAFPGYSNKILAMLYSSFEEIILLDADVVPLVPPQEFFDSKEYQSTGAYFFQDRSLRDHNDFIETNFFSTLFPTNEHSIDTLFDIPRVTDKTFNNKYMTGWRHFQEAGVVVYDKKKHFLALLMMFPLSLWTEPVQTSIWGDKEMYWLGMAMAGDESYEFNKNAAASVGEKVTEEKYKHYPNSGSNEVCSTHPGHINDDGKLLWINSGFGYCKKNGYFRDRTKFPFSVFERDPLIQLYNSPLKIRAAVIPPDLPRYREPRCPTDTSPELEFRKSWKQRKQDTDEINEKLEPDQERQEFITEWGPQKGWVKDPICFGYYYCAYDQVASYSSDKEFDQGQVFEFNEESTRMYDYLSKVWHTGGSRNGYKPPPPFQPPPPEAQPEEQKVG